MPPLGRLGPYLENTMSDGKDHLYPEIAQSRVASPASKLVGLCRPAQQTCFPGPASRTTGQALTGEGALPGHPGLLAPRTRSGQGQLVWQPVVMVGIWATDLSPEGGRVRV